MQQCNLFVEPSTIWAIGDSGTFGYLHGRRGCIRKSEDNGLSWRTIMTVDTGTVPDLDLCLRDIQFTSPDTGYVVGERGVILKTIDGGEHWDFLYTEQRTDFYTLHFFSNDQGFIAGESSILWYTDDGGATWSEERQRWGYFTDIAFTDRTTGFGCGSGIQRSTDGGKAWNFDTLSTQSRPYLHAMCFIDDQEAWAVGRDGVILHTESGGVVSSDVVPTPAEYTLAIQPQPSAEQTEELFPCPCRRQTTFPLRCTICWGETSPRYSTGGSQPVCTRSISIYRIRRREYTSFICGPVRCRSIEHSSTCEMFVRK